MATDVMDAAADRAAWLQQRRTGIGASESAAALGLSPFETPLGLYLRKVGELPDPEENEAMRWGTRLEPLLAEAYAEATGVPIVEQQQFRRAALRPHLFATIDGIDADGDLVELKTTSAFKAGSLGEEGSDELPDHWICQAHMQMHVFGRPRVRFGVLVGGNRFRTFAVDRNEDVLAGMLPGLNRFWARVRRREPPEAWGADLAVLSAMRPAEGKAIDLPADAGAWADEYARSGAEIKALEARREDLKARMVQMLGDAAVGRLPGGVELRRTVVSRKGYAVEPREFVQFSIKAPKESRP